MSVVDDGRVEAGGGGEATDEVGDIVEEVRDGVLERMRLAVVGDWRVDFPFDFDKDESLGRGDVNIFDFEVFVVVGREGFGGGFETGWPFVKRWETFDDDELALTVDVGLIERLRDVNVDIRICCGPGAVTRGI